jgi:hypothetical protein
MASPAVVRVVLKPDNVAAQAKQFLDCHEAEKKLIVQANDLLKGYSIEPTPANLDQLNQDLPEIRDKITTQTNAQAGIIEAYAGSDSEKVRQAFLGTVLAGDAEEVLPLFDKLLGQTTLTKDVDPKFKFRFLSYVLQSSKFAVGKGRLKEFMGLLGEREVVIDQAKLGAPQAGLVSEEDDAKSEKTNRRVKGTEDALLLEKGGNLAEYVKAKREQGDTRTANDRRGEISNVKVIMENAQKLLPIYFGLTGGKEVWAFTSPMFTAIHHELGHAVNRLKGKHGKKEDKYTKMGDKQPLASLTDDEEMWNISLDRFSDKAFTDELNLPERIAHGAYSSLDASDAPLREADGKGVLIQFDQSTYKIDARRVEVLQTIKGLTGKDWGLHTTGKSKPDGVEKIALLLAAVKTTRKDVLDQLTKIKGLAGTSVKADSPRRSETTKEFYGVLAGMAFVSDDELTATSQGLRVFTQKRFAS